MVESNVVPLTYHLINIGYQFLQQQLGSKVSTSKKFQGQEMSTVINTEKVASLQKIEHMNSVPKTTR